MAVEEPNAGIIGSEAEQEPAKWWDNEDVASRRRLIQRVFIAVPAAESSPCNLEVVSLYWSAVQSCFDGQSH
jgi:hypothetical protein